MAVRHAPSREDATALWAHAERERAFWTAHYPELLRAHPEQFVAVVDDRVVAADSDFQALLAALGRDGITPTQAWVRFITNDPRRITR